MMSQADPHPERESHDVPPPGSHSFKHLAKKRRAGGGGEGERPDTHLRGLTCPNHDQLPVLQAHQDVALLLCHGDAVDGDLHGQRGNGGLEAERTAGQDGEAPSAHKVQNWEKFLYPPGLHFLEFPQPLSQKSDLPEFYVLVSKSQIDSGRIRGFELLLNLAFKLIFFICF